MQIEKYYVYVYIDPRNFEEFYYGKGKGKRKDHCFSDAGDSELVKRCNQIKKDGLEPIIKVVAKDLAENEAYLIEKTLIWKLGRNLTNKSSGHFAEKFRPHNTFHLNLPDFDYDYGIFYINVGEGPTRAWDDCKKYGFLSAGQGEKYSLPLKTLNIGDIVIAYQIGKGYVGVGRVIEKAKRVNDFLVNGETLKNYPLKQPNIFENCDNEKSEYLVKVNWIKVFNDNQAKWSTRSNLFRSRLIKASLARQVNTINFIEREFGVKLKDLL